MSDQRKTYVDYKEDARSYKPIGPGQSGLPSRPGAPKKGCAPLIVAVLVAVLLMLGGLAAYLFQVKQQQVVEETLQAAATPTPTQVPKPAQATPADPAPASTPPGPLDNAALMAVIRSNIAQVRTCYEKELEASPDIAGVVRVRFLVGESGTVTSCAVTKTTLHNKTVEDCICSRVLRWAFPPPDEGVFSASYTFTFSSPGM